MVNEPAQEPQEGQVPVTEPEITDEMVESYLSKLSVDDMKKYPQFNQHTQRVLSEQDKKFRARQQQEQQKTAKVMDADAYFRSLSQDEFQRVMQNPQAAQAYQEVLNYRQVNDAQYTQIVTRQVENLINQVKTNDEFADLPIDELVREAQDPVEFILKLSDHVGVIKADKRYKEQVNDLEARLTKQMKEQLEAQIKELQIKGYNTQQTPSTPEAPIVNSDTDTEVDVDMIASALGVPKEFASKYK